MNNFKESVYCSFACISHSTQQCVKDSPPFVAWIRVIRIWITCLILGILRKVYINMPTHKSFCLLCFGINFIFVVNTEQELIASSLQCFNTVIKSYDIWTHRYNWSLLPYCLIFINNIQVDMVNNIFLKDLNIFVFKKIMILRI